MNCTFFGRRDASETVKKEIELKIRKLIEENNDVNFYVGNNGNYDYYVQTTLEKLSKELKINYFIVLSRIDEKALSSLQGHTIFPEELVKALPRYAISLRNDWLIKNCDYAIVFTNKFSHSLKWAEQAKKKGLSVFHIEMPS